MRRKAKLTYLNNDLIGFAAGYLDFLDMFKWELNGTLTTPYRASLLSVENSVKRMAQLLDIAFKDYRLFWIAEPFKQGGYHIHFTLWVDGKEINATQKKEILERAWKKASGADIKSNNKIKKYKTDGKALKYILKWLLNRSISYGFEGNNWSIDTD